jgi:hypothetical protein
VTAGWPERPLSRRLSPREQLKREFLLSGELRGHEANEPIRFAAALSEMDDLDGGGLQVGGVNPDIVSPAAEPRGVWRRLVDRRR